MSDLKVGDRVVKSGGRYGGPGVIVGMTTDLDGTGHVLYNVAMRVEGGYGQFVHVFPGSMLTKFDPDPSSGEVEEPYLIWSGHKRMWWRENYRGYTPQATEAGKYTRAEALSILRDSRVGRSPGSPPDYVMVRLADALAG